MNRRHAALLDENGVVHTWGQNGSWFNGGGQLGLNHRDKVNKPTVVSLLSTFLNAKVQQVSCGERHTLFLLDDGDLYASGVGEYGRLGTGETSDALQPAPVSTAMLPAGDDSFVQVSAGQDHNLALTKGGVVVSWGRNQSGQLGLTDSYMDMYSMEDLPRPVTFKDLPKGVKIVQIQAGDGRSMALGSNGDVWVWGARLLHHPQRLSHETDFEGQKVVKVAIGGESSKSALFFLTEAGELWAKGDHSSVLLGKAGLGALGKVSVPEKVAFFQQEKLKVLDVFAGCGQHVFVRAQPRV